MILAALWFSEQKPTVSTLLGPLIEELNDLYVNGKDYACVWLKLKCLRRFTYVPTVSTIKPIPKKPASTNNKSPPSCSSVVM